MPLKTLGQLDLGPSGRGLKPDSQEMAQNFEKRVLQKCLRITFYTYNPVNPFNFLKKHLNRCTLTYICIQANTPLNLNIGAQKAQQCFPSGTISTGRDKKKRTLQSLHAFLFHTCSITRHL